MIRILLAHDEPTMRDHLTRTLSAAGHSVVSVDRGTCALPLLSQQRFNVLLTDVVLPEMDGIELAQHCAEVSPATRLIFLNGFAGVVHSRPRRTRDRPAPSKSFHLRQLVSEIEQLFPATLAPAVSASAARSLASTPTRG